MDPTTIMSGQLELGLCEVDGRLFVLNAHVDDGRVTDLSWYGTGIESVSPNDTFVGPIHRAALKEAGIDPDKITREPVPVDVFLNIVVGRCAPEGKESNDEAKRAYICTQMKVMRIVINNEITYLCYFSCNHFLGCIRIVTIERGA
jgi:hypothetical protein